MRYRGYYYDTGTNLYYLQSRYYDANIGRFINADDADRLTEKQETIIQYNIFSYCENNPIIFLDYNGEKKRKKTNRKFNYFVVYYRDKTSNFEEQANYMKKTKYKNKDCYTVYFKSKAEFKSIWDRIGNNAIDIHLYVHGNAGQLCFKGEDMSESEMYYMSYKNIKGKVYLYSCNGGTSIKNGWSVAARLAKLLKGKKVRAVVNGSVYYRALNQIFARWPLTKEKNAYWADFYLVYGENYGIYRKKVGGRGKMPE